MDILTKRIDSPQQQWAVILPNGEKTYRPDRDRAYQAAMHHAAYGGGGTVIEGERSFTVRLKTTES